MFRSALIVAVGLFGACFPLAAQQAKHSRGDEHRVTSAVLPLDTISHVSIYRPTVPNAFDSILFHNGTVRAWSDGGQLATQNAFVQIGMAPLGLCPAAYFAPSAPGPVPLRNPGGTSDHRAANFAKDGKDLSTEMLNSPLSHVYCTGEVGFMYGQWSGKGSGDYVGSYIWGQAGNDKFQITAGASFDNWNGNSQKIRAPFFR